MAFKRKSRRQKQLEWEWDKDRYKRYLNSNEWHEKRGILLEAVGRKCEICNKNNILQIHHLTYKRLYYEKMSDFLVLCKQCHKHADKHRKVNSEWQEYFAEWICSNYSSNWRNNFNFKEIMILYFNENNIDKEKILFVFGVSIKDWWN